MKYIGNVLWFVLGGFIVSLYYFVVGILFCITIIGIPFGAQLIKLAGFALWPFGHEVQSDTNDGSCMSVIMNVIWIIGIPFGVQHFKMAYLALVPFGKKIA